MLMRKLLFALFLGASIVSAQAAGGVVKLAPDFPVSGALKIRSMKGFRGQPIVVVMSTSAKTKEFRQESKWLQEIYQQFASKHVLFIAALADPAEPIKSAIPFVQATDGAAVMSAYGVQGKFGIAIIGRDGNLDYVTFAPIPPERVRDVIQNSYDVQANTGR